MDATSDALARIAGLRAAGQAHALAALLPERASIYAGRTTADAERIRAAVLASFAAAGLPDEALPLVEEDLRSADNPMCVAAAAIALRGASDLPASIPALLIAAADRIADADDMLRIDGYAPDPAAAEPDTALTAVIGALARIGSAASACRPALLSLQRRGRAALSDRALKAIAEALSAMDGKGPTPCCGHRSAIGAAPSAPREAPDLDAIEVEDQRGRVLRLGAFLAGRPSILAFFYTRCMNPAKCSSTIVKLERLRERCAGGGLEDAFNIAAVTYDPLYDTAQRLAAYGSDRGLRFGERTRLFRTTADVESLRAAFALSVGYGPTTVNQHAVEAVVLDSAGLPRASFAGTGWTSDEVFSALCSARIGSGAADAGRGTESLAIVRPEGSSRPAAPS